MNLIQAFLANVSRQPYSTAVRTTRESITYADLDARSDRVVAALRSSGIEPGDRVAVQSGNRVEFVELLLGVAKVGAVLVPISTWDGPEQVRYLLADSAAKLLCFDVLVAEAVQGPVEELAVDAVCFDEDGGTAQRSWKRFLMDGSAPMTAASVDSASPFYIGYTSGSTGRPKGVRKTHGAVVDLGLAVGVEWRLQPGWTELVTMPMCHSGGLWQVVYCLTLGITVALAPSPGFDPEAVLELASEWEADWLILVPTMSDLLIEAAGSRVLEHVKTVTSGSAPMFTATKERLPHLFPRAGVHECYGATETGVVTNLPPEDQLRKQRCVGLPIVGVEAKVVDERGVELPPGEIGEIVARSPYVLESYHGGAASRGRDYGGFVSVGDLAVRDDEGYFYIVDRKNDMIITGGLNVYPAEVEEALKMQPGVRDAVVVGLPDPKWGERIVAAVVADADASAAHILERCARQLPAYKRPKEVRLMDELPRLVSGKNARRLVREALTPAD